MLTVVCFKYNGYRNSDYGPQRVNAWSRMFKEHLTIPHRQICITDDPTGIECETYPLWEFPHVAGIPEGRYNNYRSLKIFDLSQKFGEKLLITDIDILITKNIDSLVTDDDFKIVQGHCSPYNTSLYQLKGGAHKEVWDMFQPDYVEWTMNRIRKLSGIKWVGTNQAWISYCIENAPTWDIHDGVGKVGTFRAFRAKAIPRFIYFAGNIKPWHRNCRTLYPVLYRLYKGYCD